MASSTKLKVLQSLRSLERALSFNGYPEDKQKEFLILAEGALKSAIGSYGPYISSDLEDDIFTHVTASLLLGVSLNKETHTPLSDLLDRTINASIGKRETPISDKLFTSLMMPNITDLLGMVFGPKKENQ